MRRFPLLILLLLWSTGASLAQPQWQVEDASITFEIDNAGFPVGGSFSGLEADLRFDPDDLSRSRIVASIDAATVASGIALRDRHLRNHQYFDVERYPRIHMESVRIERKEDGAYEGLFRLRLRDVERDVTVPFTFTPGADGGTLAGSFRLDRLDFGLGEESIILSNDVIVSLRLDVSPGAQTLR